MTRPLHEGGSIVRTMIVAIAQRDGPSCRRCHELIDIELSGLLFNGPTLGHIIPVSKGGSDRMDNLGLEHRRCNLAAGARRDPPRALIASPVEVC